MTGVEAPGPARIEDVIAAEGMFVSTSVGTSMLPLIRDRRDTIIVTPPSGRLRKYDVALYRRGDRYILHRVVEVLPGGYVICGDNCLAREYDITDANVIGVLTGLYRGDRQVDLGGIGYRAYARAWVLLYPARALWKRVRAKLGSIRRRLR